MNHSSKINESWYNWKSAKIVFTFFQKDKKRQYVGYLALGTVFSTLDLLSLVIMSVSILLLTRRDGSAQSLTSEQTYIFSDFLGPLDHNLSGYLTFAILFILGKSLLNVLYQRSFYKFLFSVALNVSEKMAKKIFFNRPQYTSYLNAKDFIQYFNFSIPGAIIAGGSALGVIISDLFGIIVSFGLAVFIDFRITVYSLVFFGIVIITLRKIVGKISENSAQSMQIYEMETFNDVNTLFETAREFNAYGTIKDFVFKLIYSRKQGYGASQKYMFALLLPKYLLESTVLIGIVLLIFSQYLFGSNNDAIVLSISVFAALGSKIVPNILRLQFYTMLFRKVGVDARHMKEMQESVDKLDDSFRFVENLNLFKSNNYFIEFSHVSFQHLNSDVPVLTDTNFGIAKGTHLSIMGRNGVGKSTILDLLTGFQVPSNGLVLIEGDIPKLFLSKNPNGIAYVQQKASFFHGSIYDNILLSTDPENDKLHEIQELLRILKLDNELINDIQNPTRMSVNGRNLSGGQLQKIALARAFIRHPKILILDESTNALDVSMSEVIFNLISERYKEITVISVSHGLKVYREADKYLVVSRKQTHLFSKFEDAVACLDQL